MNNFKMDKGKFSREYQVIYNGKKIYQAKEINQ